MAEVPTRPHETLCITVVLDTSIIYDVASRWLDHFTTVAKELRTSVGSLSHAMIMYRTIETFVYECYEENARARAMTPNALTNNALLCSS